MQYITLCLLSIFLVGNLCAMEEQLPLVLQDNKKNGKKWENDLRLAIDNKNFIQLIKLLDDRSLIKQFPKELNRSFVYASSRNVDAINIKMMALFLTLDEVDINYVDESCYEKTALRAAAIFSRLQSVRYLLKQPSINVGLKVKTETNKFVSALESIDPNTKIQSQQAIIELLKKHTANTK